MPSMKDLRATSCIMKAEQTELSSRIRLRKKNPSVGMRMVGHASHNDLSPDCPGPEPTVDRLQNPLECRTNTPCAWDKYRGIMNWAAHEGQESPAFFIPQNLCVPAYISIKHIRGVGNQLAQKDLLIGVKRMNYCIKQLFGFSLKLILFDFCRFRSHIIARNDLFRSLSYLQY